MTLEAIARSFFQLLGVMFLTSETFLMALSIIIGILSALATFLYGLTLLSFDLIFSGSVLVLLAWAFIFKRYSNRDILSFLAEYSGKNTIFQIFPCERCKRFQSNVFFG